MEKVIITGGTGFIGKNLLPYLENIQAEFFILYSKGVFQSSSKNITYVKCDLLNPGEVQTQFRNLKATHLLHMAWGMSPSNYNMESNFLWLHQSMNLLEEFKRNGGRRLIMAGSGVEYQWKYGVCMENNTPLSYENLYGSTKNILRDYAFTFCQHYDIELVWTRIFFVFGPHEHKDRLVAHIIYSLLNNKPAQIRNGGIYRDYMYVKDVSRILSGLIFHNYSGIVNIGTGIPTKLSEVGKMIAGIVGKPDLMEIDYPEIKENRVVVADNSILKNKVELSADYSLYEALSETIDWWKTQI